MLGQAPAAGMASGMGLQPGKGLGGAPSSQNTGFQGLPQRPSFGGTDGGMGSQMPPGMPSGATNLLQAAGGGGIGGNFNSGLGGMGQGSGLGGGGLGGGFGTGGPGGNLG